MNFEWNVCDTGLGRCAQAFWLEVQKCELETKAEKICMLKPVGLTTRNNIFIIPLKFSLFKATHINSAGLCTLTNSFFFHCLISNDKKLGIYFHCKKRENMWSYAPQPLYAITLNHGVCFEITEHRQSLLLANPYHTKPTYTHSVHGNRRTRKRRCKERYLKCVCIAQ